MGFRNAYQVLKCVLGSFTGILTKLTASFEAVDSWAVWPLVLQGTPGTCTPTRILPNLKHLRGTPTFQTVASLLIGTLGLPLGQSILTCCW